MRSKGRRNGRKASKSYMWLACYDPCAPQLIAIDLEDGPNI